MLPSIWKGIVISTAAYAGLLFAGFTIDFRLAFFILLALQVTWTPFCVIRFIQLRHHGAHQPNAEPFEREAYGFVAGGSFSSVILLVVMVGLSQLA
jgi:hypothetical protein